MKILVPVKRVLDPNVKPLVKADGSGVDLSNAKMTMNPFCEIALEQAVRWKEAGIAAEVVALCVGNSQSHDTLRAALAMGSDRAIHIATDVAVEPLAVAKLIKSVALQEGSHAIILGKQSIDSDSNQTGQMLAALLGWPQATFASQINLDNGQALVTREVDGGLQTVRMTLPCVFTADLRLNEPRYPSLPNMMKAKKKPIEALDVVSLGVDVTPRLSVIETREPPRREAGIKVANVDELLNRLSDEAKVI